jgi:hypothetical protein
MTPANPRISTGIGSAISALAAVLAVSCGDEFQDCATSRTCKPSSGGAGSAGTGGGGAGGRGGAGSAGDSAAGGKAAAGEGGEGAQGGTSTAGRGGTGADPTDAGGAGESGAGGAGGDGSGLPTTCDRDADCADENACNGTETCEANECVAGRPVECANADSEHCAVTCETVDGEAVCGHVGLDSDDDGYKSAACSLNAGDDCNDDDPAVHPGAAEYCDGADSDCDLNADAEEDEVLVMGDLDVLVAHDDPSQQVLSASIAGFGEKATANPNSMFAAAWTHSFDDCKLWQTNLIANDASLTRLMGTTTCLSTGSPAIDVVARPEVLTVVMASSGASRTYYVVSASKSAPGGPSTMPPALSFKGSEYRLLYLNGLATSSVRRLRYSSELERIGEDIVDPVGQHIALDGAQGSAVWTLRESPTLDRVYADIGDGVVAISSESTSASHPLMAWSEDNEFAVSWRYADGSMRFKHFDDSCEVGIGEGFPGELAATPKGYVLVSLTENKREIVAQLIGPSCKPGPRTTLARVEDGSGEELSEPKIAVTGGYLRALWKRVTGDGTALESRQFRWDECE